MKAVLIVAPNVVEIQEIDEPIMYEYECLCATLAVGICNGTDQNIIGNHPYHHPHFPSVLGHEGIGRVIACGTKVKYLKPGDLVTRPFNRLPAESGVHLKFGAMAERTIVTDFKAMQEAGMPESSWKPYTVHRVLPEGTDPVAATMYITWRETYAFLTRLGLRKGDVLLVIGSGANALSFSNHAKNTGIKTIIIGNEARASSFDRLGAEMFSYQHPQILDALKARGVTRVDAIIDTVGRSESLNQLLPLIKHEGSVGVYGLDDVENYRIASTKTRGDFRVLSGEHYDEGSAHDAIAAFVKEGVLNAWDYLSRNYVFPFTDINAAIHAGKKREVFKSVITFNDILQNTPRSLL